MPPSLQDIFPSGDDRDISLKDFNNPQTPHVSDTLTQKNTETLSSHFPEDISLEIEQSIKLNKKKQKKSFDALEKSPGLFSARPKQIRLKKIHFPRVSFPHFFSLHKYVLVFFACICLTLYGYLSIRIVESRTSAGYEKLLSVRDGGSDLQEV